jgi:3-oxoacyl-[acyl-carrier-protein] synthase-3
LRGIRIAATGSYVPDAVVTNDHLREKFGCEPEWIVKMTGMRERRHALPFQATSDLCVEAGGRCLEQAGIDPSTIDLLLVATITPDMSFPSTACLVQDRLKLNCPAVDLGAACAGFMYALVTGGAYIKAGLAERVLIIAGDCMSRVVNPNDIKTYALLGDGAGAVLLERGNPDQGLLSYTLNADGSGGKLLKRPACGSRLPATPEVLADGLHYLVMDGRSVFTWAAAILSDSIAEVLAATKLAIEDIDFYVPHQANQRIINAAIDVLHIPRERVVCNLAQYGNTSAASVPLALDELITDGRLKAGHRVVISGFGAGLAWGTAVVAW